MLKEQLKTIFVLLNYTLGIIIAAVSIMLFAKRELVAPLYITAAIVVVGPIENLLMAMVRQEERWIIDQITSVIFLIFLLLAVLEFTKTP